MTAAVIRRIIAAGAAIVMTIGINPPAALAITPPPPDPALVPADGHPSPEQPMRQTAQCRSAVVRPQPDTALPPPGFTMLNIARAWEHSTGNGVRVAVIDSGVSPHPRLPVVAGGDYVLGGDGLTDCDVHGTLVASVIAAAPQGSPMPTAMPPSPPSDSDRPGETIPAESDPPRAISGAQPLSLESDSLVGVAPHATIISIRQSSELFAPANPGRGGVNTEMAGTVATLARAIVHAANLDSAVINVSVTACLAAADPLDQRALGAAVWYAATIKDAVIVAAAGNAGREGCAQNPPFDPVAASGRRDWNHVNTVSAPSWFSDFVLSVGAVDASGAPISASLAGPWVGAAAPGVGIVGLAGPAGGAVNAYAPVRPGEPSVPFTGTSFSAAYVSGVAALVRAKYPGLSARDVIDRIQQTAHHPARGVDHQVGYGIVDPVAALTFNVRPAGDVAPGARSRVLIPTAVPPPPDHRARFVALGFAAAILLGAVLSGVVSRARRSR